MSVSKPASSDSPTKYPKRSSASTKPWKPIGLRWPMLTSLAVACAAMIVVLQVLLNKQNRDGGILFTSSHEQLSAAQTFAYLYMPTLISTVFGLAWAWVDLDAKRMEPYYQLSKPGGEVGKKTLYLDYATDFVAIVPFRAFRLRHWSVFCTGIAMVLVFWALTPLTAAIFSLETISKTQPIQVSSSSSLVPVSEQGNKLNGNLFNAVYAVLWLNASLPPFTTREFALLPFSEDDDGSWYDSRKATITAPTTQYFTDLECSPALPADATGCQDWAVDSAFYLVSNGKGCKTSIYAHGGDYSKNGSLVSYHPWYSSVWTDTGLQTGGCTCPAEFANVFLAHFQPTLPSNPGLNISVPEVFSNLTASSSTDMFCEASYFEQPVMATISRHDQSVLKVEPAGARQPLSESVFNTTLFHFTLANDPSALEVGYTGDHVVSGDPNVDIVNAYIPDKLGRILDVYSPIVIDEAPLAPFAFTGELQPFTKYQNELELSKAWGAAHKVLFSLAANLLVGSAAKSNQTSSGTISTTVTAVTMSSTYTIIMQATLCIVITLGVVVLYLSTRRPLSLDREPSSIASMLAMTSSQLQAVFQSATGTNHKDLRNQTRFKLDPSSGAIEVMGPEEDECLGNLASSHSVYGLKGIRPTGLRTPSLTILVLLLMSSLTGLVALRIYTMHHDGIKPPSSNPFTNQLVLSYVPAALSTSLEPVWVMLTRDFGFLQPYQTLADGRAAAHRTMVVEYNAQPPQFCVGKAIKGHHFVLALLGLTSLMANVLNVAMSGLFILQPSTIRSAANFTVDTLPVIGSSGPTMTLGDPKMDTEFSISWKPGSEFDYVFRTSDTFSANPNFPPWTDDQYFYLPFSLELPTSKEEVFASATTLGLGIEADCDTQNSSLKILNATQFQFYLHDESGQIANGKCKDGRAQGPGVTSYVDADTVSGPDYYSLGLYGDPSSFINPGPAVHYAAEILEQCETYLLAGWFRTNPEINDTILLSSEPSKASVAGDYLVCRPNLRAALFDVKVSRQGKVVEARRQTALTNDLEAYGLNETVTRDYLYMAINVLTAIQTNEVAWHNRTFAGDWMNYLISKATGSHAHVDPQSPVPNTKEIGNLLAAILKRNFAMFLGLNAKHMEKAQGSDVKLLQGFLEMVENRASFAPYVSEISISIFTFNLIVALLVLANRPARLLPEMPTSIAAVVQLACRSHLLDDLIRGAIAERSIAEDKEARYGYGTFLGLDKKLHLGLERYPLVTAANCNKVRRHLRWLRLKDFGKKSTLRSAK